MTVAEIHLTGQKILNLSRRSELEPQADFDSPWIKNTSLNFHGTPFT